MYTYFGTELQTDYFGPYPKGLYWVTYFDEGSADQFGEDNNLVNFKSGYWISKNGQIHDRIKDGFYTPGLIGGVALPILSWFKKGGQLVFWIIAGLILLIILKNKKYGNK
jgi:predicted Zn-dependent protease